MRKHLGFICRAVIVALVMGACVSYAWNVMRFKCLSGTEIQDRTYTNFYNLPKNSIDVLFFGTSHVRESIIPQELYNKYGIVSYVLASSSQSQLMSYYWLKEALDTQSPRAMVIDTSTVFQPVGAGSTNNRKTIDQIRHGQNWVDAVRNFSKYNTSESWQSLYLPNIRYHDRWKSLKKEDFVVREMASEFDLKGFAGAYWKTNNLKFSPFKAESSDTREKISLPVLEYVEKIISLCKERGIELILTKIPCTNQNIGKYNTLKDLAEKYGLRLYDMNEESLFVQTGIDFNEDFADYGHANYKGALKVTDFIGKVLVNDIGIQPRKAEEWEATKVDYEEFKSDYRLPLTTDVTEYLSILTANKDHYTILISARDDASKSLGAEAQAALKSLGLKNDWKNAYRKSYIAVIENGKVLYEKMSDKKLTRRCAFDEKRFIGEIESAGYDCGNRSSIKIDGAEKSKNRRGLNIVVFSNDRHIVIDAVNFDTFDPKNKAYR